MYKKCWFRLKPNWSNKELEIFTPFLKSNVLVVSVSINHKFNYRKIVEI
jgi:hypothetical protein